MQFQSGVLASIVAAQRGFERNRELRQLHFTSEQLTVRGVSFRVEQPTLVDAPEEAPRGTA
jgi:hypothetical protein